VIREYAGVIAEVAATLEPGIEDVTEREETFEALIDRFEATEDPIRHGMAAVMLGFLAGLFVGEQEYEAIKDNLDLERWFRLPKSHERRIHGHRHVGVRLVLEGPTLVHALDAHAAHPGPFTADDLLPYRAAREPPCQTEARKRRTIMRKARSKKSRPLLQGNRILTQVLNRAFSLYASLAAHFSRLVSMPRLQLVSRFSKPRANRRITLRLAGALSVRTRHWSSRKLTSNCQCKLFSMLQWPRTAPANRAAESSALRM